MDRETKRWVIGTAVVLLSLSVCCVWNAAHAKEVFRFDRTHHRGFHIAVDDTDTFFKWSGRKFLRAISGHSVQPRILWQFEGYGKAACGAWVEMLGDETGVESRFIVIGDRVVYMPVDVNAEWMLNCGSYYGAEE